MLDSIPSFSLFNLIFPNQIPFVFKKALNILNQKVIKYVSLLYPPVAALT